MYLFIILLVRSTPTVFVGRPKMVRGVPSDAWTTFHTGSDAVGGVYSYNQTAYYYPLVHKLHVSCNIITLNCYLHDILIEIIIGYHSLRLYNFKKGWAFPGRDYDCTVATQVLMRIENAGSYTNSSGVFTYTDLWDFFGLNGTLKRVVW